jgi:transcriptional regulator with XRE-family HTH domain
MPKSVFGGAHQTLVKVLTEARKASGLTQAELAERVGKDQSYISLIERSQRRVDVLELIALTRAMKADPIVLFEAILKQMPDDISI